MAGLFRPSFLHAVSEKRHRRALRKVEGIEPNMSVGAVLEHCYTEMKQTYRCEYVFKNEIVQQLFLAKHDVSEATVLSEWPIAYSTGRVDLLIVNATTTSYEIKTDLDSLTRLDLQMARNLSLFDKNYVVATSKTMPSLLKRTDERVGLMVLGADGLLSTIRKAQSNAHRVDPYAVFGCLRGVDQIAGLQRFGRAIPEVVVAERYDARRAIFLTLAPEEAHSVLLEALQSRFVRPSDLGELQGLPYGLAHLYYKIKGAGRARLFHSKTLGRRAT